jgi:transcriptional regulator with PAS, ATPase and Fis domain
MLGASPVFLEAVHQARKLGGVSSTVLLTGETGVGKERFAQAIHAMREAQAAPFVAINCGALTASLVESELFGYEKGAFSGADARGKPGKIELARGGTLFLDEIGELPLDMQVKLLRVLEERAYYPVGGTRIAKADCRFIAATNRDLQSLLDQGQFREDLYYRLSAITLDIPPLRLRQADIRPLALSFVREFGERYGRPVAPLGEPILAALASYDWPGNVRELRNAAERLVVFAENGEARSADLPPRLRNCALSAHFEAECANLTLPSEGTLPEWLARVERNYISLALELFQGNKQAAARRLGISRVSLYNKLGSSASED